MELTFEIFFKYMIYRERVLTVFCFHAVYNLVCALAAFLILPICVSVIPLYYD